jgi:hypothetical protein
LSIELCLEQRRRSQTTAVTPFMVSVWSPMPDTADTVFFYHARMYNKGEDHPPQIYAPYATDATESSGIGAYRLVVAGYRRL